MPWLVLQISSSGLAVGTALALQAVPRAALMIVGGPMADRLSPRVAMLASAGVRAASIGSLAVLGIWRTLAGNHRRLVYTWADIGLRAMLLLIAVVDFCYAGASRGPHEACLVG